jgi:hypothetical protein
MYSFGGISFKMKLSFNDIMVCLLFTVGHQFQRLRQILERCEYFIYSTAESKVRFDKKLISLV